MSLILEQRLHSLDAHSVSVRCHPANLLTCPSLCSLLKFQEKGENGRETYDEYRDEAGKLVLAKGGHLAFLGDVKASCDFCGLLLEHIVRAHAQHRDGAIKIEPGGGRAPGTSDWRQSKLRAFIGCCLDTYKWHTLRLFCC